MTTLAHAVGFGLVTAAIVAVSAVAFSLQYAVTDVPNFAHGELLTISAYTAYETQRRGLGLITGLVIGCLAAGVLAFLMYRVVLRSFMRRSTRLVYTVAVTAGIALVVENALGLIYGNGDVNLVVPYEQARHVGPFLWTNIDLTIALGGLIVLAAVHAVLRYTAFGRAQRAVSDNKELALASGVRTERVIALTWVMAGVVGGLAGVALASSRATFGPLFGNDFLLVTLAAAVVGGVGRVYGAMAGALIIGVVTEVSGAYLSAGYKQVAALTILAIVLLVRPSGLLNVQRGGAEA